MQDRMQCNDRRMGGRICKLCSSDVGVFIDRTSWYLVIVLSAYIYKYAVGMTMVEEALLGAAYELVQNVISLIITACIRFITLAIKP